MSSGLSPLFIQMVNNPLSFTSFLPNDGFVDLSGCNRAGYF